MDETKQKVIDILEGYLSKQAIVATKKTSTGEEYGHTIFEAFAEALIILLRETEILKNSIADLTIFIAKRETKQN